MSEDRLKFPQDTGQEVTLDDLEDLSDVGALSEDRALQDLYDLGAAGIADTPIISVKPYNPGAVTASGLASAGVHATGSLNRTVSVGPFQFIIGSPDTDVANNPAAGLRDPRTVQHVNPNIPGTSVAEIVTMSVTAANHRWDLIYAELKTDVSKTSLTRFQKDPDTENVTAPAVDTELGQEVLIKVVEGAEAASPLRPALPANAAGVYNVPLAYVALTHPFGASDAVPEEAIQELWYNKGISPGTAAQQFNVLARQSSVGGFADTGDVWDPSTDPARPKSYLSPEMAGGISFPLALVLTSAGGTPNFAPDSDNLIDNTINWRKRLFRVWVTIQRGGTATRFTWDPAATVASPPVRGDNSSQTARFRVGFGQSFHDDAVGVAGGLVFLLDDSFMSDLPAGAQVQLYVSQAGQLRMAIAVTDPDCMLFAWIDASNQFSNGANI